MQISKQEGQKEEAGHIQRVCGRTSESITKWGHCHYQPNYQGKKDYQVKYTTVGKRLTSELMTQHIREAFKSSRNIAVVLEPFDVTQEMEMEIINAPGRAPFSKVPRPDLIIGESLWAAYKIHGKFSGPLWKACGRLAYTPSTWSRSAVVSIFKKGEKDDPADYHPIALLSHARKIIESSLDSSIQKKIQLSPITIWVST